MKRAFFPVLAVRLLIARIAGGTGSFFAESWYRQAKKSPLTPPGWVFALAWPLNYAASSMAVAIFAAKTDEAVRRQGVSLWLSQAILTSVWTRIFGDLRRPDIALASLLLSWLLAIKVTKTFRKAAGADLWMIPLLLWLTLAIELNAEFVLRNKRSIISPSEPS